VAGNPEARLRELERLLEILLRKVEEIKRQLIETQQILVSQKSNP
jgi:hypothetical protein